MQAQTMPSLLAHSGVPILISCQPSDNQTSTHFWSKAPSESAGLASMLGKAVALEVGNTH